MARTMKMCIINPQLVAGIGLIVGSQSDIMARTGISWNSWIKIVSGAPVRLSVGMRLRASVLRELERQPRLRTALAVRGAAGGRREAIEGTFFRPIEMAVGECGQAPAPRSLRQAREVFAQRHARTAETAGSAAELHFLIGG